MRCTGPASITVPWDTLILSVVLYIVVPKGFFPTQDSGAIQGISEAPQSISFAAMIPGARRGCIEVRPVWDYGAATGAEEPATLTAGN